MGSQQLPLGEAVAIVLLVQQAEDGVRALLAGLLDVFLCEW
jgi:hypothetical protein